MDQITVLEKEIANLHQQLNCHPLYTKINDLISVKAFMETHVFAVWDFMSLLKRLQQEVTCVTVPWRPSPFPKRLVRLINEIVLGEESDIGPDGQAMDHFSLYLDSMIEIGADLKPISKVIATLDYSLLPPPILNFVSFNIEIALKAPIHAVAGVFFFGREKLIPEMFTGMLKDIWNTGSESKFPKLKYYLERHIQIDGDEHSHLANEMLLTLCQGEAHKLTEALTAGIQSLQLRIELWNYAESLITSSQRPEEYLSL